jgi:hypothetical protein
MDWPKYSNGRYITKPCEKYRKNVTMRLFPMTQHASRNFKEAMAEGETVGRPI